MITFLTFLRDYEMVWYYLFGLLSLRFLYLLIAGHVRLAKANFDLERELFLGQRNGAAGRLGQIGLVAAGLFLAIHYGLPEAQRIEQIRIAANAVYLPTITPTPTPFILFNVDVGGCVNPKAKIIDPEPGEQVKGKVDIRLVADIVNFAFYKLELGTPDEPDVWIKLYSNNESASEKEPYTWTWDSTTVLPGVYHLRLTVMAANLTFPPPCIIPIQVLKAGP